MCWTKTEWDRKATETRSEETPVRVAEPARRDAVLSEPRPERQARDVEPAE